MLVCQTFFSYQLAARQAAPGSKQFDKKVRSMMQQMDVPGLSLAVVKNNRIVFSNCYGYKDQDGTIQLNKQTVFEAASLSKSFLVFVVMKLADEGKINLDQPMYTYLPYEALMHDARYTLITPRMILSHSSGLENWRNMNDPAKLEIVSEPGTAFVYSGEGFEYLSKVVEKILQKPYDRFIHEMILKPYALNTAYTHYDSVQQTPANYATGFSAFGKKINKWKNYNTSAASGMHLTAEDYARLMVATFNEKSLSASRVHDMIRPVQQIDKNNKKMYFGLGYGVAIDGGDTIVFHTGSNDGFKSWMCYSMKHRSGLAIFSNSERGDLLAEELLRMTLGFPADELFKTEYYQQYPSLASVLLHAYRQNKTDALYAKLQELEQQNNKQISVNTLNELGELFFDESYAVAEDLLKRNVARYPASPDPYYFLGQFYRKSGKYQAGYEYLTRAKQMGLQIFGVDDLDEDIETCARKMAKKQ